MNGAAKRSAAPRALATLAALVAAMAAGGCASGFGDMSTFAAAETASLGGGASTPALTARHGDGPLVALRVPVPKRGPGLEAYRAAYLREPIGGSLSDEAQNAELVATSTLVKSSAYGLLLHDALAKEFGADRVLLEPYFIESAAGEPTRRPVNGVWDAPALVTVDFSVYSFPDTEELLSAKPWTYGELVSPLLSVSIPKALSPDGIGVALVTEDIAAGGCLAGTRGDGASISLIEHLAATGRGLRGCAFSESLEEPLDLAALPQKRFATPLEKVDIFEGDDDRPPGFYNQWGVGVTRLVKQLLATLDPAAASAAIDARYAALLGPEATALDIAMVRAEEVRVAQALSSAYRRVMTPVLTEFSDNRSGEYALLAQKRELQEEKGWSAASSILNIVAIGANAYLGASAANSYNATAVQNMASTNIGILSVQLGESLQRYESAARAESEIEQSTFAVAERLVTVTVDAVSRNNRAVSVSSLAELRAILTGPAPSGDAEAAAALELLPPG